MLPKVPDDGREPMILTTMTFGVGDNGKALRAIERADPDFMDNGDEFVWTRKYPRGR